MKKIQIRGLTFDNVTMEEAVALASCAWSNKKTLSVFTPNAEIAQLAAENESVRHLLNRADILLPDGAGIILASKILKTPLTEKVAGVDFGANILKLAAREGYPVFFLGGKPGIAALAAEKQKVKFPALSVVGTHDGYFEKDGEENDAVIRQINESGAEIVFVCFGAPAQERWIDENRDKLPAVRLLMGLGGSLDIYAGTAGRAPDFFIRAGLEWLYRLFREPRRLVRMMKLPKYIGGACRECFFANKNKDHAAQT
jgi:N-acetylglucosaminyldiphosphoundecaprenol N-acetyl-beta-D-mannosaminyltransferase